MNSTLRQQALEVLRGMSDGTLSLLQGCRSLVGLMPSLSTEVAASEAARAIVGVRSETDEFPVGEQRDRWAPEYALMGTPGFPDTVEGVNAMLDDEDADERAQ